MKYCELEFWSNLGDINRESFLIYGQPTEKRAYFVGLIGLGDLMLHYNDASEDLLRIAWFI